MKKNIVRTFEELCLEKKQNEDNLKNMALALDEALANNYWTVVDELETAIRSQLDRLSSLLQNFRYLESN